MWDRITERRYQRHDTVLTGAEDVSVRARMGEASPVKRRVLLVSGVSVFVGGCADSSGVTDNNSTERDTPTATSVMSEQSSSIVASAAQLKDEYNPSCSEEGKFLKILELNPQADDSTNVVIENQLTTEVHVDFIEVSYGKTKSRFVDREFWISGRAVEAFTVNAPANEIMGIHLSTDRPKKSLVGCK